MTNSMSQSTRDEYLEKMRNRYRRYTGRQARTKLITEFCEVTSHERKYAIKLLRRKRGPGRKSPPKKRGVDKTYGEEVINVLFEIWRHSEQPCGKRLRPMIKEWLPYYERHIGALTNETKTKVQQISCAQIDRVLAVRKVGESRRKPRTPKANAAIKALVPIRAESWDAREPGWIEADTVAHCGGNMGESFIWSLTATDIFSGWTEVRPTWNRGQYSVCEAFTVIEGQFPFEILGTDTDNGGEFLNYHLHDYLTNREKPVEMTRSRPYRKNDQAHVEQKNDTHVRQLLGYDRLGHEPLVALIRDLLEAWCVWRNCFTTTFKQIETRREGNRQIRRHEKEPKTPCQRLIDYCRENDDEETATALEAWRALHDPFELKAWIESKLKQIWDLDRQLSRKEDNDETDKEEQAAAAIRKSKLCSAPIAHQNRKHQPKRPTKSNPNQDATKASQAA
jgi:hypothetical protein